MEQHVKSVSLAFAHAVADGVKDLIETREITEKEALEILADCRETLWLAEIKIAVDMKP